MASSAWPPETLRQLNRRLAEASPREVLQWGRATFGADLVLGTGFGPTGIVLAHLVSRLCPDLRVFYLETDLLFPETYALRDELTARLGLTFIPVRGSLTLKEQEAAHGPALWAHDPDRCCFVRKVLPLRRYLADKKAWVTGLRRDQSSGRAATEVVSWDHANGLVKLSPLAHWTSEDVWSYIHLNELPYNRLHDQGYPSLGCMPCTRAVRPGEDPRAGRWPGRIKTECGIHAA
jgi:phosphoadenosine phosphosulfate reductase